MQKSAFFALAAVLVIGTAQAQTPAAAPAVPATPEAAPAAAPAPADPVVISAGTIEVRRSEFENAIRSLPNEYQQYALGPGKRQFAQDVLRMKLLAAAGRQQGLDQSPEIQTQLDMMRDNLVANALVQRVQASFTLDEAALRQAYEANKAQYEKSNARHILIAFKGSPAAQPGKPELTEEEAKAKAEDLRKKIDGGASFEELAKTESDDVGSGANGGSLGEFARGQMVPEFEQAAFTAAIGTVSEPVRTQFGFHLIRVDSRGAAPFEEVRPTLERAERQQRVQAYLEQLTNDAKPTFDAAYFGS
ncbi:MAG: peptidyl-prolyl cis-trans isomerase [Candidatus Didemnitutus sp.]|nr:peptidyl-prolyl cis-trans isomerase [Candidatus Didemnitutus sp.]